MTADEILSQATPEQVKWVIARLTAKSDAEAAKAVGFHPSTVCRWQNKSNLDRAVHLLLSQSAQAAAMILSQAAPDAARVLVDALRDRRQRVQAAKEILDRTGVPAVHRVDGSVSVEVASDFNEMSDDELRAIIAKRAGARASGANTGA